MSNDKAKDSVSEKVRALLAYLLTTLWVWVLPIVLLAIFVALLILRPQTFVQASYIDIVLPSEQAIPLDEPSGKPISTADPTWTFRYAPIGAETMAGIPYWVFVVMPKIFPEKFPRFGDYSDFGFRKDDDDHEYYKKRTLPRGLVLTDAGFELPGFAPIGLRLKRVSINCSTCHRGVYLDAKGNRVPVDGMPNHSADLQGFKRLFRDGFSDERFTADRVVQEIDNELKRQNSPALTEWERFVYAGFVNLVNKGGGPDWLSRRPTNGVGRIDAFNAIKIGVIGAKDDGTVATTDFPSIWNQHSDIRPHHHWDGNTTEITTRDFGAVIGIGGLPLTINRENVRNVGEWIERKLNSPEYPFGTDSPKDIADGLVVFKRYCVSCHGIYDRKLQTVERGSAPSYMHVLESGQSFAPQEVWTGTDPERMRAFQDEACRALNSYGEKQGLWRFGDFVVQHGYLAGPLDGIWARAPYLHNGSVPTMRELLKPAAARKKRFFRGSPEYDVREMGFRSDIGESLYDTGEVGNSNEGHEIVVPPGEQDALLAYLRTL